LQEQEEEALRLKELAEEEARREKKAQEFMDGFKMEQALRKQSNSNFLKTGEVNKFFLAREQSLHGACTISNGGVETDIKEPDNTQVSSFSNGSYIYINCDIFA
jgi:hypothetical protein